MSYSRNADEKYDSSEGQPSRWDNRNPPRESFFEQRDRDEIGRKNPPRLDSEYQIREYR